MTRARIALLAAVVTVLGAGAGPGVAAPETFDATFAGTFRITFGTGPGGTDELFFSGSGSGSHIGAALVDGYSTLRDSSPGCKRIEHDEVTITSAGAHHLFVTNSGEDCIDVSEPGRIVIRGQATYTVVGGTGPFAATSGSGEVTVTAEVTAVGLGSASGTFDPLTFDGTLQR